MAWFWISLTPNIKVHITPLVYNIKKELVKRRKTHAYSLFIRLMKQVTAFTSAEIHWKNKEKSWPRQNPKGNIL